MTAPNLVTVTFEVDISPADTTLYNVQNAEGYAIASPSGTQWPDSNNLPIAPMVQRVDLVVGETAEFSLLASDNYAAGVLDWDFIVNVRGLPTINVAGCSVDYANGATQTIWSILQASGWNP